MPRINPRRTEQVRGIHIRRKRVYDKPEVGDGCRILVDRFWPRGISKQEANISLWFKSIVPSTGLRKWFSHSTIRWQEFRLRCLEELEGKQEDLDLIGAALKKELRITLVNSARETSHNQAVVLREYLETRFTLQQEPCQRS
jgi:uncharacterized protein YeaO (DUF488 family)